MMRDGKYRGRITNYGVSRSQAGKQPAVFIEFLVIGRYLEENGQLVACEQARRTYFKAITPKTIEWLASDLKAVGYDRPGLEYLDPETPGAVDLFGTEIDVVCEHETYEGRPRERWSIHRESNREKLRRDELAGLDLQFADAFRRIIGAGKPTVAPAVTEMNTDDPI
jgi:hypothetical protein